jgi:predicted acetylornithine/succinylornithine family transaminase
MNTTESSIGLPPDWAGSLAERGAATLLQTYGRYPIEFVSGYGCMLTDSSGREYLDFTAGIAVNVLGHAHPAIIAALHDAAGGLLHVSNLYWTEPMVRLAERLTAASGMEKVFFCNSGAEAVEAALKLARRARPNRPYTICFDSSFHGRTLGALSMTAQPKYQDPFRPLLPDIVELPFGDFDAVAAALDDQVAAVIVEPIQGEGGIRPAPSGWLAHIRDLCAEKDAVLIFDEVQSGIGRTGTFFSFQAEAVLPDIVVSAKALAGGLPMGALLARGNVASAFQPGDHGSTFGGGPLVASVANAVFDHVLSPGFLDAVVRRGRRLRQGLQAIVAVSPDAVSARGRGLMLGLVLSSPVAPDVVEAAQRKGLLLCPAGPQVVSLVPPLTITDAEIDRGLAMLKETLSELPTEDGAR